MNRLIPCALAAAALFALGGQARAEPAITQLSRTVSSLNAGGTTVVVRRSGGEWIAESIPSSGPRYRATPTQNELLWLERALEWAGLGWLPDRLEAPDPMPMGAPSVTFVLDRTGYETRRVSALVSGAYGAYQARLDPLDAVLTALQRRLNDGRPSPVFRDLGLEAAGQVVVREARRDVRLVRNAMTYQITSPYLVEVLSHLPGETVTVSGWIHATGEDEAEVRGGSIWKPQETRQLEAVVLATPHGAPRSVRLDAESVEAVGFGAAALDLVEPGSVITVNGYRFPDRFYVRSVSARVTKRSFLTRLPGPRSPENPVTGLVDDRAGEVEIIAVKAGHAVVANVLSTGCIPLERVEVLVQEPPGVQDFGGLIDGVSNR